MRFRANFIFLSFLSLLLLGSCKKNASTKSATPAKTAIAKKKANTLNSLLRRKHNFTAKQIAGIKKTKKDFNTRVKTLKKSNKWAGDVNKANRLQANKTMNASLKTLLGKKYAVYKKASKAWKKSKRI